MRRDLLKRKTTVLIISVIMVLCSVTFAYATDESAQEPTDPKAIEKNISEQKHFALFQIDALVDMGYTYDEISKMSLDQVNSILTKDLNAEELASYNAAITAIKNGTSPDAILATPPAGYTHVAVVPDGGGTDEWFHPNVNTTESTISGIVTDAKAGARKIFNNYSLNYPDIRYSYYICGEWGEDPGYENWCHEGVDLKNAVSPTAAVYSPISGVVSKSSTSGKYVNIYNSSLGITMNFQHLNNVDGTGKLLEGQPVSAGQFLGNQNTTDGHVHVQVCTHASCTSVHSGRDLTLVCIKPYQYIK